MPLAVVITRDVEGRYRGFLSSAMLELAPGVYANPRMSAGVRTRIWAVLSEWHGAGANVNIPERSAGRRGPFAGCAGRGADNRPDHVDN